LHTALVSKILKDPTLWDLVEVGTDEEPATCTTLWKDQAESGAASILF
jgi:hypothetical protein